MKAMTFRFLLSFFSCYYLKMSKKEVEEQMKSLERPQVLVCKCPLSWNTAGTIGSGTAAAVLKIVKKFAAQYMTPRVISKTLADDQV